VLSLSTRPDCSPVLARRPIEATNAAHFAARSLMLRLRQGTEVTVHGAGLLTRRDHIELIHPDHIELHHLRHWSPA
jgi:hypothetical protein